MFRFGRSAAPIRVVTFLAFRQPHRTSPLNLCFLLALSFAFLVDSCARASDSASGDSFKTVELNVLDGSSIHFVRLSTDQGLSDSVVFNILHDDQGFMWFGTPNGLNRYDGYEFKVYRPGAANGGLSGSIIIGLIKDRSGSLWFGADQFLDRFDPVSESVTEYASDPKNSASLGGTISQVAQDGDGQIWVATSNGLDRLDAKTGSFIHYRHNENDPNSIDTRGANRVNFVAVDHSNTLWIETTAGINSVDPKTGRVTRYPELRNNAEFHVQHVYQDRLGRLWIYSREGSGIGTFDPATRQFVRYKFITHDPGTPTAERVTSIIEDQHGTIWFGTGGSGLLRFDPQGTTVIRYRNDTSDPYSLSNNFVLSLSEDSEGGIWVGTGGGGINRFSANPPPFKLYRKHPTEKVSLNQNFVLSVFEDSKGVLWVGNDGALNRIDPSTGDIRYYRQRHGDPYSISDGTVLSTVEDRTGMLWFATYRGGLNSFDRKTRRFKVYGHDPDIPDSPSSNVIMRLQLDPTGLIWLATDHNLDRFDPITKHFDHFRALDKVLGNTSVTCLTEDHQGRLWLGTSDRGLIRFNPTASEITPYANEPGKSRHLSSNRVNALLLGSAEVLWVGTQQGLNALDLKTGKFRSYTEADGLPSSAVEGILQDRSGKIWVSAGSGLAKLDPRTNTIRNYYAPDGIAADFNFWNAPFENSRGEMFFPGVNGLTVFNPEYIHDDSVVPAIVLTDFWLFGTVVRPGENSPLHKSISVTQDLVLPHSESVFSFEFSCLSYTYPERNRYRYMLDGLDRGWNEADSRHRIAAYTTLAPGNYVLRLQGSNSRGVWNKLGVTLHIRILPPWWRTWWFRAIEVALIVGVVGFLYYLRVWTVERRNRELAVQIAERTAAEEEIKALSERLINAQEEERARIARELHDNFNQQIAGISLGLGAAKRNLSESKAGALEQLEQVRSQLGNLANTIRELSHELHPAVLDCCDLPTALKAHCKEFSSLTEISVEFVADGTFDDITREVALCLYRVTQEALQNVAKHAGTDFAEVQLVRDGGNASLIISDKGNGFSPDRKRPGARLGLVSIRERVRLVRGRFDLKSEPNRGTTIRIEVPVHTSAHAIEHS